jgi:hypothetical protein
MFQKKRITLLLILALCSFSTFAGIKCTSSETGKTLILKNQGQEIVYEGTMLDEDFASSPDMVVTIKYLEGSVYAHHVFGIKSEMELTQPSLNKVTKLKLEAKRTYYNANDEDAPFYGFISTTKGPGIPFVPVIRITCMRHSDS